MNLLQIGNEAFPEVFSELSTPEQEAVELVAYIHDNRDREQWGGLTYWTQLSERIQLARIGGPRLSNWLTEITEAMSVTPRKGTLQAIAPIVAANNPATLQELAGNTEWIITLVRLANDHRRGSKPSSQPETPFEPTEKQGALL